MFYFWGTHHASPPIESQLLDGEIAKAIDYPTDTSDIFLRSFGGKQMEANGRDAPFRKGESNSDQFTVWL